ncbi:MAG: hypothetical protein R8F63_08600 [Acidimicrobiales bacterium]|nr:hypothetical protein [Acidimicrobiales bacterium]
MGFDARVIQVLVASPGDTKSGRDAVEATIGSWNRDRAVNERVVLLPLRWEQDSVPTLDDGGAQAVINRQLVDGCDVVVALFHARLGSPTGRADSGTAEEIERARDRGIPVHVYFSEMPISREDLEPDEIARLVAYKEQLQAGGLLGSYASLDDLRAKVRTALEADIAELAKVTPPSEGAVGGVSSSVASPPEHGRPLVRGRYRQRSGRGGDVLTLENIGALAAVGVDVAVEPVGDGRAPQVLLDEPLEVIPPGESVSVLIAVTMGTASQWKLRVTFSDEEGRTYEEVHTLTPF